MTLTLIVSFQNKLLSISICVDKIKKSVRSDSGHNILQSSSEDSDTDDHEVQSKARMKQKRRKKAQSRRNIFAEQYKENSC